jgi:hypothetical protein
MAWSIWRDIQHVACRVHIFTNCSSEGGGQIRRRGFVNCTSTLQCVNVCCANMAAYRRRSRIAGPPVRDTAGRLLIGSILVGLHVWSTTLERSENVPWSMEIFLQWLVPRGCIAHRIVGDASGAHSKLVSRELWLDIALDSLRGPASLLRNARRYNT